MTVTIKDIARKLGISPSTVSRALRNHPDISPETKERVNTLANALDYQPNSIAQSLQKKRTNLVGVVVPEIEHHFFSAAINGIEEVAYNAGYAIIVTKSNEDCERESLNIKALISNRVAGLVVSISETTRSCEHFKLLMRQKIPFVFFDRVCEGIRVSEVVVDDFEGAFSATEHLIERGYRKIAHIGGPEHLNISRLRYEGYSSALRKYSLTVDEKLVVRGGLNEEDGRRGCMELLELDPLPDAIFSVNDPVAIGAFEKIKQQGLKIPEDIALVGFSNNPISSLIDPALTTVGQPAYEMGKIACDLLLQQINSDENFIPRKEVLKTELIIRNST